MSVVYKAKPRKVKSEVLFFKEQQVQLVLAAERCFVQADDTDPSQNGCSDDAGQSKTIRQFFCIEHNGSKDNKR